MALFHFVFSLWESNPIFPGKLNISGNVSNGSKNAGKLKKQNYEKKSRQKEERERERGDGPLRLVNNRRASAGKGSGGSGGDVFDSY